jgi:hypothetical protein
LDVVGYRTASGMTIGSREVSSVVAADADRRSAVAWIGLELQGTDQRHLFGGDGKDITSEIGKAVADQLKKLATSEGDLTHEQRAERLKQVKAELFATDARLNTLRSLRDARPDAGKLLSEKLNLLNDAYQNLELQFQAKEARKVALREGLDGVKREAAKQRDDDVVTAELEKLLKMHMDELARSKQMHSQGMLSSAELTNREAALSEAKIRLAERQTELARGGKGDLLERMSNELAMVSVDLLELDVQLSRCKAQLAEYDIASRNPQQLEELLAKNPQLGGKDLAGFNALLDELTNKLAQLHRERFALSVDDVSLQTPTAP